MLEFTLKPVKSKLLTFSLRRVRRNQNILFVSSTSYSILCTKSHGLIFSLIVVKKSRFSFILFSEIMIISTKDVMYIRYKCMLKERYFLMISPK